MFRTDRWTQDQPLKDTLTLIQLKGYKNVVVLAELNTQRRVLEQVSAGFLYKSFPFGTEVSLFKSVCAKHYSFSF